MPQTMKRKRMTVIVDPAQCTACRSCELACAVEHSQAKTLKGALGAGEKPRSRVHVIKRGAKSVPVQCKHCKKPKCVMACPSGALVKDEESGLVLADDLKCVGCEQCVEECPFGAISMRPDGKGVIKCDVCIGRVEQGLEPACVHACPTKALLFSGGE